MGSELLKLVDNSVEVKIRIIKDKEFINMQLMSILEGEDNQLTFDWHFYRDDFIRLPDMIEAHSLAINKRIKEDSKT